MLSRSVLQCCAEMYVSSEQLGSEDMMGPAGAEGHIRTISLTLLRLQSKIDDPFDDLKADLQVCSLQIALSQATYDIPYSAVACISI